MSGSARTSSPINVAVLGASGRLGAAICRGVQSSPDLHLALQVGRNEDLRQLLRSTPVDVAVDVTHPDAVMHNIKTCLGLGVHVVAGTSGFTRERLNQVQDWLEDRPELGVHVVPNFALGAVVMMHLAQQVAALFSSVEIVEAHHPDKVDAPSGTAVRTVPAAHEQNTRSKVGRCSEAAVPRRVWR